MKTPEEAADEYVKSHGLWHLDDEKEAFLAGVKWREENPRVDKNTFLEGFRIAWITLRPGQWTADQILYAQQEYIQWKKEQKDE